MKAKPLGDAHFRVNADGFIAHYHSAPTMPGARVAADVVGRHVTELVSPGTAVLVLAAVKECLATESVVDIIYASEPGSGNRVREASFVAIGGGEVLAVVRDITDRQAEDKRRARDIREMRAAQKRLKISEERFRALVAESSDVILVLTAEGQITYASPAFERLLGYPEGSLLGTLGFDIIHPDDLESAATAFAAAFTGDNAPDGLQYRVRHADGSWRWTESHTTNHLDTPGVNGFIVNARDITARHEANAKLEQASDLLASVMGAAGNEAIIVTDKAGTIVAFSRGAEILLGYTATEVLGVLNPIVFHVAEDVAALATELGVTPEEMFVAGPPEGQSIVHEWVFVRRDGSRFDGLLNISGRLDSSGTPCGFVAVARDITEYRRRQAELTHKAHFDELTGLANRAYLQVALNEAADDDAWDFPGRIMLFIDLDHFKQVNDTLGHAAGDAVLAGVAERLRESLRVADLPARIGGDEFVVLLGPNMSAAAAADVAARIVEALAMPFAIVGTNVTIGASVGLATSKVHTTPEALLHAADTASYSAKHAGRGRVVEAAI